MTQDKPEFTPREAHEIWLRVAQLKREALRPKAPDIGYIEFEVQETYLRTGKDGKLIGGRRSKRIRLPTDTDFCATADWEGGD